jgi:hypothetical protein
MNRSLKAIYRGGGFIPQQPCDLPEESEVSLIVQGPGKCQPKITDQGEVVRILKLVTERMKQNPLPTSAPRFTREDLHGRR